MARCPVHPKPKNETLNSEKQACGLIRRLLAMVYDAIIVLALMMVATLAAMLLGFGNQTALRDPVFTAYLVLVWFLYVGGFWTRGGMTVGMRAWRVRIENASGERPGWTRSAVRFAVSLLSAALAGAGFLWSLFDAEKRSWHDLASGTRLVRF